MRNLALFIIAALLATACSYTKPFFNKQVEGWENLEPSSAGEVVYSVYLIGDAGAPKENDSILALLKQQLDQESKRSSIVWLGDNIYPQGMPHIKHPGREDAEWRINQCFNAMEDFKGKVFFIPGNHDWAQGRDVGYENALHMEEYLREHFDKDVFLPGAGCPGPEEIKLADDLVLILINTQWWLHYEEKPGVGSSCDARNDNHFLIQLSDAIKRNAGKRIIVAGHHPVYTYGPHGGRFKAETYLAFPYPLFRGIFGDVQDRPNFRYKALWQAMRSIFNSNPNIIYASGHEHSLQYIHRDDVHYVVSGSGSKNSHVAATNKAIFTHSHTGFSRIRYYDNGDVWLEFLEPGLENDEPVFRQKLYTWSPAPVPEYEEIAIDIDSLTVLPGSKQYKAGGLKRMLWGSNYRSEWRDSVVANMFDISTKQGGLRIQKRGGGMQTKSLRLKSPEGKQYVLRSVEKYAANAIPPDLQNSFVEKIVQDQISNQHPYAALVVPYLAKPIGVYYAMPELVYIPHDRRLGKYYDDFAGTLALYEERVSGNQEDMDQFGNPRKIVSSLDMLADTYEDNDHLIDQQQVLISRIFDIYIGDWDRHDDQWRWGVFKHDDSKGKLFKPIPRDRDQVFFWSNGAITRLFSKKWGLREFQGFDHKLKDVIGLNRTARYFDRSFMNEPDRDDWKAAVDKIQTSLTDNVIESAIGKWQPAIYNLSGEEIISKLKARRDGMDDYMDEYYQYLTKEVEVVGSDKHEFFEVKRLNDDETEVTVYKRKKDGDVKHQMYHRIFRKSETREIRLYGLDGNDSFRIIGDVKKALRIRIIAGEGDDVLYDQSNVSSGGKKTIYYEYADGFLGEKGKEAKLKLSDKPENNEYDRKAFEYNYFGPLLYIGFNNDDGVFIGGGFNIITHGFRKEPFATKQSIVANYAIRTGSFNIDYSGTFTKAVFGLDLEIDAFINAPNFVTMFYGIGNKTARLVDTVPKGYYNVRFNNIILATKLRHKFSSNHSLAFGIRNQWASIPFDENLDGEGNPNFITDTSNNGLAEAGFDTKSMFELNRYVGVFLNYRLDQRDSRVIPLRGYYLDIETGAFTQIDGKKEFTRTTGELSFYLTTFAPLRTTFAVRVGGAFNTGEYEVYHVNTLGQVTNLRGFRRNRYSGGSSFYQNNDIRIKLGSLRSLFVNGEFGLIGFFDWGRVWHESDKSANLLHTGYGGGIWWAPFKAAAINIWYAASADDNMLIIRFGFLY